MVTTVMWLRSDRENIQVNYYRLPIRQLPSALDGFNIVQLSDLHCGSTTDDAYLYRIESTVNALHPDVICLTGDYVYHGTDSFERAANWLGKLQANTAVVGVLGNHDYWQNEKNAYRLFPGAGLKLIDNRAVFVNSQRQLTYHAPSQGLCIAGLGDSWEGQVNYAEALGKVPNDVPRLVIAHNPDVILLPEAKQYRIDLLLAGHSHGGQVSLPLIGPLGVSSVAGKKLTAGWVQQEPFPCYVNVGLGETVLPFRHGVRPEISVFTLVKS